MTPSVQRPFSFRLGGSLFEVIIVIGLLALFASTLFVSMGTQLMLSAGTYQSLQATALAQEGLEAARSIRDAGWSSLAVGTHGLLYTNTAWSFQHTSDTNDVFTRTIAVTALSAHERQVISTVSWMNPSHNTRSTSLATTLSNWRNVFVPLLHGNWSNPQTLGTIDLGSGNVPTGIVVKQGMVYMSATASARSKPDFFVIDAQQPASPFIVGSLQTGSGVNGLAVSGTVAYLANDAATDQLQLVSIATPSSPNIIRSFHLEGSAQRALSIALSGSLVMLGTQRDAGPDLFLVDVSDPNSPRLLSSLEIGGDVNRISILGNRAYLATGNSAQEFIVVDIANPSVPAILAHVNLAGSESAATGLYINSQDSRAYITRQQDEDTSPEVNIYSIASPAAPTLLGNMEFSEDIPAVLAADTLLFLGTTVSNLEFQIFDVTNPASPVFYAGLNFPQVASDIAFENNTMYVAVRSNDALRILTAQ